MLRELLDGEINVGLQTFAFDSFRVWIGDELNGFDLSAYRRGTSHDWSPSADAGFHSCILRGALIQRAISVLTDSDNAIRTGSAIERPGSKVNESLVEFDDAVDCRIICEDPHTLPEAKAAVGVVAVGRKSGGTRNNQQARNTGDDCWT